MKRIITVLGTLLLTALCAAASADTEINKVNFPDDIFRSYVSETADTDNDGILNEFEIANILLLTAAIKKLQT